jgi:hypothetical protein
MSKRRWVLLGVASLVLVGLLIPAAAGGTRGAPSASDPGSRSRVNATLRSSHVPVRCSPGAAFGSVAVPVGIKTPGAATKSKQGTNALVRWTIDGASGGSNKRFVPYNATARLVNTRVPCSSPLPSVRPRLSCRLVVRLHPLRLLIFCHLVEPAS